MMHGQKNIKLFTIMFTGTRYEVVSWAGFEPRPVHVWFVVDRVALLRFFPCH